jgi:outer membrane protein assembly factor BamB/tetratricopeptide (TPR) repeat protein
VSDDKVQVAAVAVEPLTARSYGEVLKKVTGSRTVAYLLASDGQSEKCVFFPAGGLRLSSVGLRRGRTAVEAVLSHPSVTPEQRRRIEQARAKVAAARARGELKDDEPGPAGESGRVVRSNELDDVLGGGDLRPIYHECCRAVVRDELIDMLLWDGADLEFRESNPPPKLFAAEIEATKLSLGVKDVLEEVQRLSLEWQKLALRLGQPSRTTVRLTNPGAPPQDAVAAALVEAIGKRPPGECTLDDAVLAVRAVGIDAITACQALLALEGAGRVAIDAKPPALTPEQKRRKTLSELDKIEQAIQLMIQQLAGRKRMAQCFEQLGELPKAVENWRLVGEQLEAANRAEEAVESYRNIVRIAPEAYFAREKIAGIFTRLGRVSEAVKEWLDLSRLFARLRLFNRAQSGLRQAMALEPNDPDHRRRLIDLLEAQGKKEEAGKQAEELARFYEAAGQPDAALACYQQLARLVPDHAGARERLTKAATGTHALPLVGMGLLLLLLAGGGAWLHGRYTALEAFRAARAQALTHAYESRYRDARAALDAFQVEHDFDPARVDNVRAFVDALLSDEATGLLARAQALEAEGHVPEARELCRRVEATFPGTPFDVEASGRLRNYLLLEADASQAVEAIAEQTRVANVNEALAAARALMRKASWTEAVKKLQVPLELRTSPPGAAVTLDAQPHPQRTPCVVTRPATPSSAFTLKLTLDGYQPHTTTIDLLDPAVGTPLKVDLQRAPRWRAETLGPLSASPWVGVDGIVLGGADQRVFGLGWDGQVRWTLRLDLFARAAGSPVNVGDLVVVVERSSAGQARALAVEVRTGKLRWERPLEGDDARAVGALGAEGAEGVVLSTQERLLMLDAATGEERWALDLPSPLAADAQVAGERLLAATVDGRVQLVSAAGKLESQLTVGGRPCAPPVGSPQGCLVGTEAGELLVVWRSVVWKTQLPEPLSGAPLVADGIVYAPAGRKLVALDLKDGTPRWERAFDGRLASPAVNAGRLYVGAADGAVHALVAQSGDPRWVFRTGGPVHSAPVLLRGVVFVASGEGVLYAIPD